MKVKERLTTRFGLSFVGVSGKKCPKTEKRGYFCNEIICELRANRECHFLKTVDRLAELEDKIENGELVSKDWHDEQALHDQEEIERLESEKDGLINLLAAEQKETKMAQIAVLTELKSRHLEYMCYAWKKEPQPLDKIIDQMIEELKK